MAHKQTRQTISISRAFFDALKDYSRAIGVPASNIIESLLYDELTSAGFVLDKKEKTGSGKHWDPQAKRWTKKPPE